MKRAYNILLTHIKIRISVCNGEYIPDVEVTGTSGGNFNRKLI